MAAKKKMTKAEAKKKIEKDIAELGQFKYDGKNWQGGYGQSAETLRSFLGLPGQGKPIHAELDDLEYESERIVVAVVEYGTARYYDKQDGIWKKKTKKLPDGMAAAQAAHAVSKLKLKYALQLAEGQPAERLFGILSKLMMQGITTIVVKVRDEAELVHVRGLATQKNLLMTEFHDTNEGFYGCDSRVLTAVAIGPINKVWLTGVTDYLPLWKCGCRPLE